MNSNNRDALYQRLGIDLTRIEEDKSDEAPTERKKSYRLPTIEPMMQTLTYVGVRLEERSPAVNDNSSETFDENISDEDDEENIVDSDSD